MIATVSFRNRADSTPEPRVRSASSRRGPRLPRVTRAATSLNAPASARAALTAMSPKRSTSTSPFTCSRALSKETAPVRTRATAPTRASTARLRLTPGRRPNATASRVARPIAMVSVWAALAAAVAMVEDDRPRS